MPYRTRRFQELLLNLEQEFEGIVRPNQRMQPTTYRAAFQVVWRLCGISG